MGRTPEIESAIRAEAVTPNDSTGMHPTRGIYVGVTGDLKVDMFDNTTVTFISLAAGIIHPLQVRKVYSTGTTATSIVAVY